MIRRCAFGPALYKFHENIWTSYKPGNLERWSDNLIMSLAAIWSISFYVFPFILVHRRSYSLAENAQSLVKVMAGAGAILVTSLVLRGYARANNPNYVRFIQSLTDSSTKGEMEKRRQLLRYDFDFKAWPVDWKHSTSPPRTLASLDWVYKRDGITLLFCKLIAYAIAHTVALKLMYPGSMSFLNWAMSTTLLESRITLLEMNGERFKLLSSDKNEIDAMFIDGRNKSRNGDILVITCEGNCGFYEIGIVSTPLKKGYSVLGWNHPGFGGSTGQPLPMQEQAAIDCVMNFAIEKLNFPVERIILYGWSIGGYTATWAAANYPQIDSLVLDATFDDVLPLAIARMPKWIECIVRIAVREHLNLNIGEMLNKYDGPVLIVRRTDDEIMAGPNSSILSNQGNPLVIKLLKRRYPELFVNCDESHIALTQFLAQPHDTENANGAAAAAAAAIPSSLEDDCIRELKLSLENATAEGNRLYPSRVGLDLSNREKTNIVKFLVRKYMEDQASQHCQPLAAELFHPGWNLKSVSESKPKST